MNALQQMNTRRAIMIATAFFAIITAVTIATPSLRITVMHVSEQMTDIPRRLILIVLLLKIVQTIASTLSWRNVLRAAYPNAPITFKRVFVIEQSKDGIAFMLPSKVGAWAMLSAFRLSIPGAQMPTILAAWGVQSLGFAFFGIVNTIATAVLLPGALPHHQGYRAILGQLVTEHPLICLLGLIAICSAIAVVTSKYRGNIDRLKAQVGAGIAIAGSPGRYLKLVFLPCMISYCCRVAIYIALLSAFGIPVTPSTVTLAITSHAIAGAIRFTPGGFVTTQAIDVATLHAFASSATIAAYSLTQGLLMTMLTMTSFVVAALWTLDRRSRQPIDA